MVRDNFLVLSVTRQIFLPAARLLGVPPPRPLDFCEGLSRAFRRPPCWCRVSQLLVFTSLSQRVKVLVTQSCLTLCDPVDWSPPPETPLSMWILQARTLVGCHALLQGIFPTQGSKPGLLHCRPILYHLSHQGSPPLPTPTRLPHLHLTSGFLVDSLFL